MQTFERERLSKSHFIQVGRVWTEDSDKEDPDEWDSEEEDGWVDADIHEDVFAIREVAAEAYGAD